MPNIWKNPVSADWTNAADWTLGVPTNAKAAIINAIGTYTVTISSADKAHSLTVDAAGATLSENSGGSLTMAGGLTLDTGTVILNGVNSFGGPTQLINGTLKLGNADALGTSALTMDGGALVGTTNMGFFNTTTTNGSFALAAAHGDTVKLRGQTILNMHSGDVVTFGQAGDDGVFVWAPVTLGIASGGSGFAVDVNDGVLRDGNGSLSELLSTAQSVNVATGAIINIHGNAETIGDLSGGGVITSSLGNGALTIGQGDFSGNITGALALTVDEIVYLAGTSTYTGGTIINNSATLVLEDNGSIRGGVVDDGTLDIEPAASRKVVLNGISGSGRVELHSGTVILNGIDTYTGGTTIDGGILRVGNGAALGSSAVTISNTRFEGTATEAISNQLMISGSTTFMTAHGTTLTLNAGAAWTIGSNAHLVFGSSTSDGVVVWDSPVGSTSSASVSVVIAGGTLRAGDSNFGALLNGPDVDIQHDAALDVAGSASRINTISGDGTIENSGAAAAVTIGGGIFTGTISGAVTLDIGQPSGFAVVTLGGNAANCSAINVESNSQLELAGPSSANIVLSPLTSFVSFRDPGHFTGSISGFQADDRIYLFGIDGSGAVLGYSGDATGGTLTVSNASQGVSFGIHLLGNYTVNNFFFASGGDDVDVLFEPSAPVAATAIAPAHVDTFDFSAAVAPHVAMDASIASLHDGHGMNVAFAHDVTEALHAHDLTVEHFTHDLFAHGHGFAEALL